MSDTNYVSQASALTAATAAQTRMANCVMRLFKATFNPQPENVLADFIANECDYAGYASKTIATWQAPILAGNAYLTYAPTQTFLWVAGGGNVVNDVGGYFLVLAGGALDDFAVFDPSQPMAGTGQAIVRAPSKIVPWG